MTSWSPSKSGSNATMVRTSIWRRFAQAFDKSGAVLVRTLKHITRSGAPPPPSSALPGSGPVELPAQAGLKSASIVIRICNLAMIRSFPRSARHDDADRPAVRDAALGGEQLEPLGAQARRVVPFVPLERVARREMIPHLEGAPAGAGVVEFDDLRVGRAAGLHLGDVSFAEPPQPLVGERGVLKRGVDRVCEC